jgi:NDP-sugar pyrophosphorylase family protein
MERRLFANWTQPTPLSLERDLFPVLASEGSCFGFPVAAEVIDIGTEERYAYARQRLPSIIGSTKPR